MTTTPHEPTNDKPRRTTKPRREVIATDAPNTVPVQGEIPGTEQKRVADIEDAADKYAAKERVVEGLKDELKNLDAKLREVVHANADKIERNGEGMFVYRRGEYNVVVTPGKEKLKVSVGSTDDASSLQTDEDAE